MKAERMYFNNLKKTNKQKPKAGTVMSVLSFYFLLSNCLKNASVLEFALSDRSIKTPLYR